MQINLTEQTPDLDLIRDQLYKGSYADLADATGYSRTLIEAVMTGQRRNALIIAAAQKLIELHRENLKQIEIHYHRSKKITFKQA
jgi:hypothetical protein